MQELFQKMQNCKGVCFAEVPLLFESGFEDAFDEIIVIMRNKEKRIKDVCERDNITRGQVLKRMQAQVDYDSEELRLKINRLGGYIIENEKDVAFLETQMKDIVKQLSWNKI